MTELEAERNNTRVGSHGNIYLRSKSKSSLHSNMVVTQSSNNLTLKAPIMTAADDFHKYFFIVFLRK